MSYIKVKILDNYDNKLPLPKYETKLAAGADLRASLGIGEKLSIKPGQRVLIPTGLSFEIAPGFEVQVRPRSGLSLKTSLLVVNSPGTIDADYRGEIRIIMINLSTDDVIINDGERICQMIISKYDSVQWEEVDMLEESDRGAGGFGHTGKK